MQIDFLIVGQGLAGSLLAWELLRRDCKVIIVDNGQENASQIAAGLINPITGLRFVKTTDIEQLLPAAVSYYADLAAFFGQAFFIEKPMLRIFQSQQEAQNCQKRQQDPTYQDYWQPISHASHPQLATPYGYVQQKQTGYLATLPLLTCLREFFIARGCYQQTEFDYAAIRLEPVLRWQNITAQQIIFCEGYRLANNPWFGGLPLQAVKGELLTVQHHADWPDAIVNNGHWLVPLNPQYIRIGATFDRDNLDTQVTVQGQAQLLAIWQQMTGNLPATVIKHQANIRPCTLDKQPFVGLHRQYPQLAVFNGFGAKGSVQIPWYSQGFVDALLNGAAVPADIKRINSARD
jgi:glycine/D-amino acid oxidase-like deaminating enzyme